MTSRPRAWRWFGVVVWNISLIEKGIGVFRGIMMWFDFFVLSLGSVSLTPSECELMSLVCTERSRLMTACAMRPSPPVSLASRMAA